MTTILPPERTPLQVITKQISEGLTRVLPSLERSYNQRRIQNALSQLDSENGTLEQLKSILPTLLSTPGGAQAISAYQNAQQNASRTSQLDDILRSISGMQGAQGNGAGVQGNGGQPQNTPDLTHISEYDLAKLSITDPQSANALRHMIEIQLQQKAGQQKSDLESLSNTKFSEGYQAIQDDDMETLNKIISDPKTPYEVKNRLTNLKNQHDVRSDVRNREVRTRQNYLKGAYSKAINNEKKNLENRNTRDKDKPEIRNRMKELIKLQRKDMKRFTEDPESYPELSIWNSEASQYLPEEEFAEGAMGANGQGFGGETNQISPKQDQRVVFNPKNPEHRTKATQLYEKLKDKEKVRQILSKEFEGL